MNSRQIANHVRRLVVAVLDADPQGAHDFTEGDAALEVTRAGVTFKGFDARPDGQFVAVPVNDAEADDYYLQGLLHQFEKFLRLMLSSKKTRSEWFGEEFYVRVSPTALTARRVEDDAEVPGKAVEVDNRPMPGHYL